MEGRPQEAREAKAEVEAQVPSLEPHVTMMVEVEPVAVLAEEEEVLVVDDWASVAERRTTTMMMILIRGERLTQ